MRYGLILIFLVLMGSMTILNAQNFNATATAQIQGATQTAIAQANQPQSQATDDPFQLTATALVRAATLTAEAFTGDTAVPITVDAQAENAAELTATALVEAATAQVGGGFGTGEEPLTEEETNSSAMGGTVLIFMALLIGLVLLGVALVYAGRRGFGRRS
jgi:hypothetical protein